MKGRVVALKTELRFTDIDDAATYNNDICAVPSRLRLMETIKGNVMAWTRWQPVPSVSGLAFESYFQSKKQGGETNAERG